MHWFLDHYDENPEYRFVSDGNPYTVSVPRELLHNVNMDSLGDKTLLVDGIPYIVATPEIYYYEQYDEYNDIDYDYYDYIEIEYDYDDYDEYNEIIVE